MRVTVSAATFLAWVSAVVAQTAGFDAVLTPTKDEVVTAGSTYTITWDYSSTYAGTVSIQILEGATPTTLQLGEVIACKFLFFYTIPGYILNEAHPHTNTYLHTCFQQLVSTTLSASTRGPSTLLSETTPPTA